MQIGWKKGFKLRYICLKLLKYALTTIILVNTIIKDSFTKLRLLELEILNLKSYICKHLTYKFVCKISWANKMGISYLITIFANLAPRGKAIMIGFTILNSSTVVQTHHQLYSNYGNSETLTLAEQDWVTGLKCNTHSAWPPSIV